MLFPLSESPPLWSNIHHHAKAVSTQDEWRKSNLFLLSLLYLQFFLLSLPLPAPTSLPHSFRITRSLLLTSHNSPTAGSAPPPHLSPSLHPSAQCLHFFIPLHRSRGPPSFCSTDRLTHSSLSVPPVIKNPGLSHLPVMGCFSPTFPMTQGPWNTRQEHSTCSQSSVLCQELCYNFLPVSSHSTWFGYSAN